MDNKKPFSGLSILIFGSGGRQTLPMSKGFFKLGCHVTIYCKKKTDMGYMTRYAQKKILYDEKNKYGEDVLQFGARIIREGHYDLVVPMGDLSASFLSQHKGELTQYSKIAVNDWNVFENVIDKTNTMRICEENGIPAPKTLYSDDPIHEIQTKGLSYPVVVKPKTGVGSIGFNIVKSEADLIKLLNNYNQENGPLFVQEYITQVGQPQYGGEFFRDRDGNIKASLVIKKPRWYPIDGGSTVLAVSVHDDEIKKSCINLLDALNWNGCANFDLVVDQRDHTAKILEINPRPSAIVKLSFLCGVDFARLILENEMGYPVTDMTEYEDNKQISCLLADCLWFAHAKNRWSARPSWFARWKIKDTIFSWDDPIPTVGFLISNIVSFKSAMQKRKRIE